MGCGRMIESSHIFECIHYTRAFNSRTKRYEQVEYIDVRYKRDEEDFEILSYDLINADGEILMLTNREDAELIDNSIKFEVEYKLYSIDVPPSIDEEVEYAE